MEITRWEYLHIFFIYIIFLSTLFFYLHQILFYTKLKRRAAWYLKLPIDFHKGVLFSISWFPKVIQKSKTPTIYRRSSYRILFESNSHIHKLKNEGRDTDPSFEFVARHDYVVLSLWRKFRHGAFNLCTCGDGWD